jgi:hypothetical protein
MRALDSAGRFLHTPGVHLPALTSALVDHFGPESDVQTPEDESEAWRSIVQEYRRGGYPHLLRELDALLADSDGEITQFLTSHAPAWSFDSAEEARRGLEVLYSYVQTYGDQKT